MVRVVATAGGSVSAGTGEAATAASGCFFEGRIGVDCVWLTVAGADFAAVWVDAGELGPSHSKVDWSDPNQN